MTRLKTLLELERTIDKHRPSIIEETIYKNGDVYYEIVTDSKVICTKLQALKFDHVPRINCWNKIVKKQYRATLRAQLKTLDIDIITFRENHHGFSLEKTKK